MQTFLPASRSSQITTRCEFCVNQCSSLRNLGRIFLMQKISYFCTPKRRRSSDGRAEDWKSLCHWFDSSRCHGKHKLKLWTSNSSGFFFSKLGKFWYGTIWNYSELNLILKTPIRCYSINKITIFFIWHGALQPSPHKIEREMLPERIFY